MKSTLNDIFPYIVTALYVLLVLISIVIQHTLEYDTWIKISQ